MALPPKKWDAESFSKWDGQSFSAKAKTGHLNLRALELAAYLIPRWLLAAPRASAKAYVKRINSLLPPSQRMSAAQLLFDVSTRELNVRVPAPLAGFTIAQFNIPRDMVVIVSRKGADKKDLDKSTKSRVNADDILRLRGTPHALATVASMQVRDPVLLKPKEMEGMRTHLRAQKDSLAVAAQELHDRLLPRFYIKQRDWRERDHLGKSAVKIQARHRGKQCRRSMVGQIELVRLRVLSMRLAARRMGLNLMLARYNEPIVNRRLLRHLSKPSQNVAASPAVDKQVRVLDLAERSDTPGASAHADAAGAVGEPLILQGDTVGAVDASFHVRTDAANVAAGESFTVTDSFMYGMGSFVTRKRVATARAYRNKLNTLLKAAPEAAELSLPLPLLALVATPPVVSVTAQLTVNEVSIGALTLPPDVHVEQMTINKQRIQLNNRRLDQSQKLLKVRVAYDSRVMIAPFFHPYQIGGVGVLPRADAI